MDLNNDKDGAKVENEIFCLADDSETTHTILKNKRYFFHLILTEANIRTIYGIANFIEGSERANILLPGSTMYN